MSSPSPSDEEVERAWRAGAGGAFAELFRRHYARLLAYVTRLLGEPAAAEDVVQQAFLNVARRRSGSGRFQALLYTSARNLALNERRRLGRRYVARTGLEADASTGPGEGPLEGLLRQERADALAEALESLPEDEREAFLLKEREGLTYPEVAQVMGLHPDAVRRRVAKAHARLRDALDPEEERP